MSDNKTSWFMRLRHRLALLLLRLADSKPFSEVIKSDQNMIDDGIDYTMPVVVPDWWPDSKKQEAVLQSMREHGWTSEQIAEATAARQAAFEKLKETARKEIDRRFSEAENESDESLRAKKLIEAKKFQETSAPYQDQFSAPNQWQANIPAWPSADPLREWDSAGPLGTTSTRREILMRTHLAWERNPVAKQAVAITTQFAMGDGLTLKCYNPDVEEVLEEFRDNKENGVELYEKLFCTDLQIDGELFIRFYKDDGGQGRTLINPLKPWEIWWIETERGFPMRPVSYHWYSLSTNFTPGDLQIVTEDIPAAEVLHITINRHSYEQRGRPDLFNILPWLKAYKDWLENRARQNFWRGALLWWVKLINGTPAQVSGKRAQYKQPPPPGSMVVSNDKEEWSALQNDIKAGDAADDGRQIKLMSAIGKGLPEYMLSDGQNANLASASAQQLPALRTFGEYQDIMVNQVWWPIYTQVIHNAIDAGILPEEVQEYDSDGDPMFEEDGKTPKMIETCEAFGLEAPELESDDPNTLAQALQIAVNNEWASGETAAGRMGFDYTSEQKKIEREKKAAMVSAYQGGGRVPLQPGQAALKPNGQKEQSQNGNGQQEPATQTVQ